ncbi:acyl-CoA transferase [Cereibacter sp. SYSU M97828]|nr:acyl-CoA transferase [Cereibacter flavus]
MPSTAETALQALYSRLSLIPVLVMRNEALGFDVPATGALNLRDGDPGEPDVTLSPLRYHFEHLAELEVFAEGPDADDIFDALKISVGEALLADRTLGGTVDWLETAAPAPEDLPILGADTVKAAVIPIRLFYVTPDPLI